jgi:hypothetical protein
MPLSIASKMDLAKIGNTSIGRMYLGPRHSWEKYVKHIAKTDRSQFSHTQYDVPEEVRVTMNDRS